MQVTVSFLYISNPGAIRSELAKNLLSVRLFGCRCWPAPIGGELHASRSNPVGIAGIETHVTKSEPRTQWELRKNNMILLASWLDSVSLPPEVTF
jgi:hypothetical protein